MSTSIVQYLISEVGLPAPLTKPVEGNPYEAGKNLVTAVIGNDGSFSENPSVSKTQPKTLRDFAEIDTDAIIDDLLENLREGGKVKW